MTSPNQQQSIDLLRQMVGHYSPSGHESQVTAWLAGFLGEWGWQSRVDEVGNIVAERGQGERHLVFLGHIDTVTGEIPLRLEDGILYGRGSVDAKGPLAAFLCAGAQAQLPDDLRITCIGAVEEETSTSKGARHVAPLYRPDYLIIGEPSGWDSLCMGYKGNCHIRLTVRQPRTHGASGVPSAGTRVCQFWQAALAAAETQRQGDKVIQSVTVDVSAIETGVDGLDETGMIRLDIRTPPGVDNDALRRDLEAAVPENGRLEFVENLLPARGARTGPLIREFRKAIAAVGDEGATARFSFKTGTSDMNIVAPVWNCPMLAYGPGDSSLDHTPNEHIRLDAYLKSIQVLRRVLENL